VIVDPALQLMMDAVHRYEGYVAQSRGDGIFALFGAPIAQEDHARRALYAALRMQEEIKRYSDRLRIEKGVLLQIRVGLNSGEMVVRSIRKDDLHTDYVPIGHSVNLAARMEGLAMYSSSPRRRLVGRRVQILLLLQDRRYALPLRGASRDEAVARSRARRAASREVFVPAAAADLASFFCAEFAVATAQTRRRDDGPSTGETSR